MSVSVVLVAAGRGSRFGPPGRRPKQFRPLRGRPLFYWPLKTFESTPSVSHTLLVVPAADADWVKAFVRRHGLRKVRAVVEGGRERADSVRRGLRAAPKDTRVVLIHDAARPLVSRDVVERVIAAARRTGAALAAWPVPDTLKLSRGQGRRTLVKRTAPRAGLWLAQTPQGFRWRLAERLMGAGGSPTDDVQWAERAGHPVEIVLGSPRNFKVTVPEDFKMCESFMRAKA